MQASQAVPFICMVGKHTPALQLTNIDVARILWQSALGFAAVNVKGKHYEAV